MKDKMRKLLESVVQDEQKTEIVEAGDFRGDNGVGFVPAPEFSGATPSTDLPQEGEGKSKEAKNADFKGKKKDEPKKLKEGEEVEKTGEVEVVAEDAKDELTKELNDVTAKISYYQKNYNAGDKKGVAPSEELKRLEAKKAELKEKMARLNAVGPKKLQDSYQIEVGTVDVSEDIDAIFSSDDELTEEFKSKVKTIFEAAVITKANEVVKKVVAEANENIEAQYNELDEKFDALHVSLVEASVENFDVKVAEITEKMEAVTDKAIEEWKEENKVAIHSAMKVDIAESFMASLKDLFETHNIEVVSEKVDVTNALIAEVDQLKEKLEKEIEANLALKEEIEEKRKKELVNEISEGLTEVEKGKFEALSENIDYTSDEDYASKLKQIKESYFAKKVEIKPTSIDEGNELPLEEPKKSIDPLMEAILAAGRRFNGKK